MSEPEVRRDAIVKDGVRHDVTGTELEVGQQAPDINLTCLQNGEVITTTLSAQATHERNMIVWLNELDSSICSLQARVLAELRTELGINMIVITAEGFQFQAEFLDGLEIDLPVFSINGNREAAIGFGVWIGGWGKPQQAVHVVDKDLKILEVALATDQGSFEEALVITMAGIQVFED